MKKKLKKIFRNGLLYSAFTFPLLFGCEKEIIENFPEKSDVIISEKTKILTDADINNICSYDNEKILFNAPVNYEVGDILVAGKTEYFPKGILKKITEIDGGNIAIKNSSLEEVLIRGKFNFEKELISNDLKLKKTKNINSNYNFCEHIDTIIYDHDGNFNTTNDQVRMNGNFKFNTNITMDAEFNAGIKNAYFSTQVDGALDLNFEATFHEEFKEEVNIADLIFNSIAIPGAPVPLVATPRLELIVGAEGYANGKIYLDTYTTSNLFGKIEYNKSSGWSFDKSNNVHFEVEPEIKLNADIKAYAKVKGTLIINGILGGFSEIEEYVEMNADIAKNPWWTISRGLDFNIGVNAGFFSSCIPEYNRTIISSKEIIVQAETAEKPVAKLEVNKKQGIEPLKILLDASGSTSGKTIEKYEFVFGDDKNYIETRDNNDGFFDGKTSHIYSTGKYLPSVLITDSIGRVAKSENEIEIKVNSEWESLELSSDDGTAESDFGFSGFCKSTWPLGELYTSYKKFNSPKYPYKLNGLKLYIEAKNTNDEPLEVRVREKSETGNILKYFVLNSNEYDSSGYYSKKLENPILFNEGPIIVEISDRRLPENCSGDILKHGWKFGLDENSSGNSSYYYSRVDGDMYVYSGTNCIDGEIMMTAKGEVKSAK